MRFEASSEALEGPFLSRRGGHHAAGEARGPRRNGGRRRTDARVRLRGQPAAGERADQQVQLQVFRRGGGV